MENKKETKSEQQDELDLEVILHFFKRESATGILLLVASALALLLANSPLERWYGLLLDTPLAIQIGQLAINKPLLLWINDGLMALFFLLVGLELKREFLEGELSNLRRITLPALGAIGGMLVPALVYVAFNYSDPVTLRGWAIPAATDIAFALGVLSLFGSRVPIGLKLLLTSIAIFDDLGAIIIIALFYTDSVSLSALGLVAVCALLLFILNRKGINRTGYYVVVGVVMWVAMLHSGVHATLAGVLLALFIPHSSKIRPGRSTLKRMEKDLHPVVMLAILPIFAFANAGVDLTATGFDGLLHPVTVGIALGLFVGKQAGIFGACWIGLKLGLGELPKGMNMPALYGTAALCGIGFTMSLFIDSLAFQGAQAGLADEGRLGILIGSLAAGIFGCLVLNRALDSPADEAPADQKQA